MLLFYKMQFLHILILLTIVIYRTVSADEINTEEATPKRQGKISEY